MVNTLDKYTDQKPLCELPIHITSSQSHKYQLHLQLVNERECVRIEMLLLLLLLLYLGNILAAKYRLQRLILRKQMKVKISLYFFVSITNSCALFIIWWPCLENRDLRNHEIDNIICGESQRDRYYYYLMHAKLRKCAMRAHTHGRAALTAVFFIIIKINSLKFRHLPQFTTNGGHKHAF